MALFPVVPTDFPLFRVHVKSRKNLGRVYLEQFCITEVRLTHLNIDDKFWVILKSDSEQKQSM